MNRNSTTLQALLLGAAALGATPLALAQDASAPRLYPLAESGTRATSASVLHEDLASKLAPPAAVPGALPDADLAGTVEPVPVYQAVPKPQIDVPTSDVRLQPAFDKVIYDAHAIPGHVLARGRGWKVAFGPTGLTYVPVLGRTAPRSFPTSFTLASVRSGGAPVAFEDARVSRQGSSITLDRGSLRETYHLDADVVEQTFVFDSLPSLGELVVEIAVDSPWHAVVSEEALRFVDETYGEISYGRAFVHDANGLREEIARVWTGTSIALIVPATFLATATFPVTIDPPIGQRAENTFGGPDDSNPDIAFEASSGKYWMTWQDFVSATDADVYVTEFAPNRQQGTTVSIDMTTKYWDTPAIAAAPHSGRVLIVASTTTSGPGSSPADIEGRLLDTSGTQAGVVFTIDQLTHAAVKPDVGGQWLDDDSEAEFCVVWERVFSVNDHDIHARRVDAISGPQGTTIFLANSGSANDFAPAISASWGDPDIAGHFWNVAWIRDEDGNGRGTPFASRIAFDGASGEVEFQVFSTSLARNVSVTSTFDEALPGNAGRPFLVAYERSTNGGDIQVTVCAGGVARGTSNLAELEDFDVALEQREPSIATDGTAFFLTYSEEFFAALGVDFDTFMVSGNISALVNGGNIALGERHAGLAETFRDERATSVATQFDGGGGTDNAMVVWERRGEPNGALLELMALDAITVEGSIRRAVGRQYCDANPHANSAAGGRLKSWLWLEGSQRTSDSHEIRCLNMKRDAFAFIICSRNAGNVSFPGGSAGHLCLGGDIGRVVGGQIRNSGPQGSIIVSFQPTNLPSPSGPVSAAPGETWRFQCWHRDVAAGGVGTSNFSNAVAVTFQ